MTFIGPTFVKFCECCDFCEKWSTGKQVRRGRANDISTLFHIEVAQKKVFI